MTKICKLTLIKEVSGKDDIGQVTETESKTTLIAEVSSVTQSEFMQGQQDGLSPAYVFKISIFGYSGERIVEFGGDRYSIYRTYLPDDNHIELYTELEVGSHTAPEEPEPTPEPDPTPEPEDEDDG